MFKSQKSKILGAIIILTSFCILVFIGLSYYEVNKTVTSQMKNDGTTLIGSVSRELSIYSLKDSEKIREVFLNVKKEGKGNLVYLSIVDKNQKVLVTSDNVVTNTSTNTEKKSDQVDAVSSATDQGNVKEVIKDLNTSGFIYKTAAGEKVYNVSSPFYDGGNVIGTINIGISLSNMNNLILRGILDVVIVGIILMLIATALGFIIARNITKPLEGIVGSLEHFAKGDFTVVFKSKGKDEIKKLTDSLNKALISLKDTIAQIKNTMSGLNNVSNSLAVTGEVAASSSTDMTNGIE